MVVKVIATFAKFVNHFSRSGLVVCEVPMLGSFVMEENGLDFMPSAFFTQETAIAQSNRKIPSEGILKKELKIDKIGQLCSLSNDLVT